MWNLNVNTFLANVLYIFTDNIKIFYTSFFMNFLPFLVMTRIYFLIEKIRFQTSDDVPIQLACVDK